MRARLWRRAPRWMVAVVVRLMGWWRGERGMGIGKRRVRGEPAGSGTTVHPKPHRATWHRRARTARSPFPVSRSRPSIKRPDERIRGVVLELGVMAEEGQLDRVGG